MQLLNHSDGIDHNLVTGWKWRLVQKEVKVKQEE